MLCHKDFSVERILPKTRIRNDAIVDQFILAVFVFPVLLVYFSYQLMLIARLTRKAYHRKSCENINHSVKWVENLYIVIFQP